jgi:hypothetical protein
LRQRIKIMAYLRLILLCRICSLLNESMKSSTMRMFHMRMLRLTNKRFHLLHHQRLPPR